MLLGAYLSLQIGPTVPVPAPPALAEALLSAEVTQKDEGRSGFQLTFAIGRSGPLELVDYPLLQLPLLRPFNRVILEVLVGFAPRVLMDGVITHQELSPGDRPGTTTLSVTGEDVSVMMDLEEKIAEHPGQTEMAIAAKLIARYRQFGLIPFVVPPPLIDVPVPTERTPVQHGTDLEYLNEMAGRYGYVFYLDPGPAPLTNTAYWGPPRRFELRQTPLSVNVGPDSNISSIRFQHNALAPTLVSGRLIDRRTLQEAAVQTDETTRRPPLASEPALPAPPVPLPPLRRTLLEHATGLISEQARAYAQGQTDRSVDAVVSAQGELDAVRYGDLLKPYGLVGLRGAGFTYDGLYYVKSVTHKIRKGEYKQSFTLTREGTGALSPVV
jgi:hypothetical protein